ncbi:MAG: DUF1932 domain-containing protein [Anaerolineales bacterium]|nr:DUF1932 domain-containing protein [Anaerolineales bacterium]
MGVECIGVLGFGEVGSMFSNAMAERGARILVYDSLFEHEPGKQDLASRIQYDGIELVTLEEMLSQSEMILSVVTTEVAEEVALQVAEQLLPRQIYVDLNSTSPAVKKRIGHAIEIAGASFVEGAILGAVGATGVATRVLMAGEKGEYVARLLKTYGLNTMFYSAEVGKAATFKMLRSIFSKGLEALMLELMIAGNRAGIGDDLWADVTEFMSAHPFDVVAANWIRTHAVAYERRYHELVQVLQTMNEVGVEPIMTSASASFFERSLSFGFDRTFKHKPEAYGAVVRFMDERLAEQA